MVSQADLVFKEWRHTWTFSGLWMLNIEVWYVLSSLSKMLVHFCTIKNFWLD